MSIAVAFGIILMGTQAIFAIAVESKKAGKIQSRLPLALVLASLLFWWLGAKHLTGIVSDLSLSAALMIVFAALINAEKFKQSDTAR